MRLLLLFILISIQVLGNSIDQELLLQINFQRRVHCTGQLLKLDTNAGQRAAMLHALYLVTKAKKSGKVTVGHVEGKGAYTTFTERFSAARFDVDDKYAAVSEIVMYSFLPGERTNKQIAQKIVQVYKSSPPHWDHLLNGGNYLGTATVKMNRYFINVTLFINRGNAYLTEVSEMDSMKLNGCQRFMENYERTKDSIEESNDGFLMLNDLTKEEEQYSEGNHSCNLTLARYQALLRKEDFEEEMRRRMKIWTQD